MEQHPIAGLGNLKDALPRTAPTGFEGDSLDDAVRDLITTYHDLNSSTITELDCEPSPLEFLRHVSQNRPFVIRHGASSWAACQKWNASYLSSIMGNSSVNVAITPHGNADSILSLSSQDRPSTSPNEEQEPLLFVKPYETQEPFTDVLESVKGQHFHPSPDQPTRYAQTQNDNLRNEYASLFSDVPKSIPFARIALDKDPDAINFWLGNSSSTTALHKDNYENMYVQVLGQKHFVLLPPIEAACINEKAVLAATYQPQTQTQIDQDSPARDNARASYPGTLKKSDLVVKIDEPHEYVPFATWDPDTPSARATRYSHLSQPMRVTLDPGDMLYLPALWSHKVTQSCSDEGICVAVNYWYDLEYSGSFWAMAGFTRGVGLLSLGDKGKPRKST